MVSIQSRLLSRLAVTQERDSRWGEYAHLAGSRDGLWNFLDTGDTRVICRGSKVWVPEAMVPEILSMYHDDRGHFWC